MLFGFNFIEVYMTKFLKICCFFLLSFSAFAGDVYVIANSGVTLSQAEVKDVFLGEKQTAGSVKLTPVDNKSAQADFLSKVLSVDKSKYDAIWAKKSFQDGLNAPKVKGSDADVIEHVKSTPGGVGYVSAPGDSKVIGKF